jgi:O-methyltransferase
MIDDLLARYPLVSDQVDKAELRVILRELAKVLDSSVPGAVVEFGCYTGTTALFIARLLAARRELRQLHVYDSFAGLPPKTAADASPAGMQFQAGELRAAKADLIRHFKQAGLALPVVHKAWFAELGPDDVPPRIAFAFLDGDFYESIRDSLRLIWPCLAPGATVLVDDYQSEALPGVRRAVGEWLARHGAALRAETSLAIIRKNA